MEAEERAGASSSKVQQKDDLILEAGPGHIISQTLPSTSLVEDSDVHGRDEDKETLIRLLLADDIDNKIGVVPIVGMGGIRKTTLAQFLYDDVGVRQHFELRAWVCVSEEFDVQTCESKSIVTTRNERVASVMGTFEAHRLMQISENDCWLLLAKHSFKNARVIEQFYQYLPPHLKRCFAYCSVFPKDYKFCKQKFVLHWMAEDIVQPQKKKTTEEVGENYFDDLLSRSFLQYSSLDNTLFIMHDLINDLAKFVSGEFCIRFEDNNSFHNVSKARHFSYMKSNSVDFKLFDFLYDLINDSEICRSGNIGGKGEGGGAFPNIHELDIHACPKYQGNYRYFSSQALNGWTYTMLI